MQPTSKRTHCPAAHAGHVREGHGLKPGAKKGGRGRLIGETKGGMNRCPADDWNNRREGPSYMQLQTPLDVRSASSSQQVKSATTLARLP